MIADLSKYKVVHKDKVVRALCILDVRFAPYTLHEESVDGVEISDTRIEMPELLTLLVINDDCTIGALTGNGMDFQFIPNLSL